MLELKFLYGAVAILLTIIGYIPYIKDVINGQTKPHIFSWLLFALITLTAFALQWRGNAGIGSLATLTSTMLILTVVFLSIKKNCSKDITIADGVFVILTLISLGVWIVAKQPMLSAIFITVTDLLAYGPTIRKSWKSPYSETLVFFIISAVRYIFIILSLQSYSVTTMLYPFAEFSMLLFLASVLLWRRNKVHTLTTVAPVFLS